MATHYTLAEHKGGGQEARFYIDGERVSRERYEDISNQAYCSGRLSCFHTVGKERPDGKTRRVNYSEATI